MNVSAAQPAVDARYRPIVTAWLLAVCSLVILMVAIGGITRLSGSGLSIVKWQPVSGVIPPLNRVQWENAFAEYKQFPQFLLHNQSMTLTDFKFIYFWEYIHRLLGRFIGAVYVIPLLFFLLKRKLAPRTANKLLIGLMLGAVQAIAGWWMVKSGLVENPYVNHYRLAIHLLLAVAIIGWLFWIIFDLYETADDAPSDTRSMRTVRRFSVLLLIVVLIQITYGAFTAGLKAGFMYNTFPLMHGRIIAPESFSLKPFSANFFENPFMVQFVHRAVGITLAVLVLFLWLRSRARHFRPAQKRAVTIMAIVVLVQVGSGVVTLLLQVPVPMAVIHQVGAVAVFLTLLLLLHMNRGAVLRTED